MICQSSELFTIRFPIHKWEWDHCPKEKRQSIYSPFRLNLILQHINSQNYIFLQSLQIQGYWVLQEAPEIWRAKSGPTGKHSFQSATWIIFGGWRHHYFQNPCCQVNRKITGTLNQVLRLWSSFFLESFLLKKKKRLKLWYLRQLTTKGQVCKINCVAFILTAHLPHMSFITQWKTIKCTVVLPSGIMHLTALFV